MVNNNLLHSLTFVNSFFAKFFKFLHIVADFVKNYNMLRSSLNKKRELLLEFKVNFGVQGWLIIF